MKPSAAEIDEARAFFAGRHQPKEWDAGFDFYSRPLWQQRALRILGMLLTMWVR